MTCMHEVAVGFFFLGESTATAAAAAAWNREVELRPGIPEPLAGSISNRCRNLWIGGRKKTRYVTATSAAPFQPQATTDSSEYEHRTKPKAQQAFCASFPRRLMEANSGRWIPSAFLVSHSPFALASSNEVGDLGRQSLGDASVLRAPASAK